MLKDVVARFFDPEVQLRQRLFQLLSTIALAEFIIVTLYSLVLGSDPLQIATMLLGTAIFAATAAYTMRSGNMRVGATITGLLYFSIYPLTFFSSAGMYGGAPVVFAFAIVYVFLVTQKWERVLAVGLCVAASAACYALSYLYPELLERHTVGEEHLESLLSIFLVALLLCMLFTFVTEVYLEQNRVVQRQKREIEELSQAQKRFFSSMSHEIRTPVNAIVAHNELIMRETTSPEIQENCHNIEVASRMLLTTIGEILDMSRLETGSMEIVAAPYRTCEPIEDVVGLMRPRAQEKGLDLNVHVDPALPTTLEGDKVRIQQVLLNVMANAVKYTPEGSVTLEVTPATGADGTLRVAYEVSDTGIGIREEDLPHLFSAFRRADEAQTHAIEGTGLGLSIVSQLVDLMGGTIEVTSTYGEGSRFRIEICQGVIDATPIGEVSFERAAPATTTNGAGTYESAFVAPEVKVLAVDDTPMNLMVVRKLLRDTEVDLTCAASGAEALELCSTTHFDVILMDHQMPGMDGVECLHALRAQEGGQCRDSRIVCLTANAGADMEPHYLELGFDGYMVKPVRGEALEEMLARMLALAPEK